MSAKLYSFLLDRVDDLILILIWVSTHPWGLFAIFLLPLVVFAWWRKVYPHVLMSVALIIAFLITVGDAFLAPDVVAFPISGKHETLNIKIGWLIVLSVDLWIFVLATVDFMTIPRASRFTAERQTLRIASLKQNHRVSLTITNRSRRRIKAWIRDDVPQEFTAEPKQFVLRMPPRSRSTVHYEMLASRRGAFKLESVFVRCCSRLRLWQSYLTYPVESVIHVYPDMKQLAEYAVLARTNRLSLMGVRRTRKVGQDNDFERLRDYTPDDNYKHIEWRTTARRNKLTVKDFQTSQSQRIIFLLDCGRMMTNVASGLSLLDHSLNAMLMMSFVALRQGDSVGLICFSDQVHTYVPPRSGMKQMNQLLHASFDRFPQLVESRYDQAFLYLRTHCRKRSLVVMISNVIDEVNSHQVEQYLGSLVGHHLPLGVMLRDHQLFDVADAPSLVGKDLYRCAAAAEILTWRHQVLTDLEHKGVLMIDSFPENMTAPLVNRYLEIKARHLL